MAIVFDPITQRQVQVPDPPLPSAPPPPVEHVMLATTPPPAMPPEFPQSIVTEPMVSVQGSSAAAPAPETDLPAAPPSEPTPGTIVDNVV